MAVIRPHLKEEPPPQENYHYNRTYEAVYALLERVLPRTTSSGSGTDEVDDE